MKLAVITPGWMTSAYKATLALSKKNKIAVIIPRNKPFPGFSESKTIKIYELWDTYLKDPINSTITPTIFWKIFQVKRKEKPKVWLNFKHMFFPNLAVPLLKLFGEKVITATDTFPGQIWWTRSRYVNFAMWLYANTIGRIILRCSDKVILLHEELAKTAKKMGLDYKVIHNGVDLAEYDSAKPPKDLEKNSKVVITYIGRFAKVKGYDDLIDVARKIVKANPTVEFWFVGGEKKTSENGIKYLGFRNDVPGILKMTDIYVLPSYSEGLPNTLMEAMAAKVAVVSTAVGGVKTLIKDGKNGLLCEPANKKQLEEKINTLIENENLRTELSKNARETIKKHYDWNKLASKWMKTIEEIAKK